MIIKAPDEIGGFYQSIAPGHGGLSFIHVDSKGNTTAEHVPIKICRRLCPEGWTVTEINGIIEGYRPYIRLASNILSDHDHRYMYELTDEGYEFWLYAGLDWESVRNESRKLSLKYFLTHENILTPPAASEIKR